MNESNDGLIEPNKSKNNIFRTYKFQIDSSQKGVDYYRMQIPKEIAEEFPQGTRFWIGHKPGTNDIQLFKSGTYLPNPIVGTIERPKKLKQEDFLTSIV